ncbi:MAG TPA: nucleotidyltransferase domain-containing protein [Rhodothermia bacterium]|nr:nucleotidyltransferase domain-containing protein [Rhodothermia bacterium]
MSAIMNDVHERLYQIDRRRRAAVISALAARVGERDDVAFAYLHGSFVGEDAFHDIDVAVYFSGSLDVAGSKALDLANRLSMESGYPVDIRVLNDAPLSFQFRAVQGTLLVSRDDEQVADFVERTGMRYADVAPRLLQATRDAFAR